MKKPRDLKLRQNGYYGDALHVSHLLDTKRCHIITSSYGELSSVSLTKTEVKRLVNWLSRWLEFRDDNCTKDEEEDKN